VSAQTVGVTNTGFKVPGSEFLIPDSGFRFKVEGTERNYPLGVLIGSNSYEEGVLKSMERH